jgi:hypothetical protein
MSAYPSLELFSKPSSYKFSEQEKKTIRCSFKKSDVLIKYGIIKKPVTLPPIAFLIDFMPYSDKVSFVERQLDIISKRKISDLEYEELVANFGMDRRRFRIWNYYAIEFLQEEDNLYGVETPQIMIDECVRRGLVKSYQKRMFQ